MEVVSDTLKETCCWQETSNYQELIYCCIDSSLDYSSSLVKEVYTIFEGLRLHTREVNFEDCNPDRYFEVYLFWIHLG